MSSLNRVDGSGFVSLGAPTPRSRVFPVAACSSTPSLGALVRVQYQAKRQGRTSTSLRELLHNARHSAAQNAPVAGEQSAFVTRSVAPGHRLLTALCEPSCVATIVLRWVPAAGPSQSPRLPPPSATCAVRGAQTCAPRHAANPRTDACSNRRTWIERRQITTRRDRDRPNAAHEQRRAPVVARLTQVKPRALLAAVTELPARRVRISAENARAAVVDRVSAEAALVDGALMLEARRAVRRAALGCAVCRQRLTRVPFAVHNALQPARTADTYTLFEFALPTHGR